MYVLEADEWLLATALAWGEPADAVEVSQPGVVGGVLRRDVLWVRRASDGVVAKYRYEHVRARPPERA